MHLQLQESFLSESTQKMIVNSPQCRFQHGTHNRVAGNWYVDRETRKKQTAVSERKHTAPFILHPAGEQLIGAFQVRLFLNSRANVSVHYMNATVSMLLSHTWSLSQIARYALNFPPNKRSVLYLEMWFGAETEKQILSKTGIKERKQVNLSHEGRREGDKCREKGKKTHTSQNE